MFSFFFLCSIRVVKIRQIESENEFRLLLFLHAKHVTSSEINVVVAILKKANPNAPNTKQQATRQSNSLDYVLSDNIICG